jgi:large subunit ribosomal protein L4
MIEVPVYNKTGKQVGTLPIDESALGGEVRPVLLKQAYVMFHANRRQGSARTKNRSRVEGSTRKLFRQKGTGNARAGTVRTNLRKGGGVAFAKLRTHEDFRKDMPVKMRKLANRNALLAKLVDQEVKCFDELKFDAPRTKDFGAMLEAIGIDRTCLVALDPANTNAQRSARNLNSVTTIAANQLNVFELLNHRYLVTDKATLQAFIEGASNGSDEKKPTRKKSAKKAGKKTAKRKTTKKEVA